jgi:hypothetical protein
MKNNFTKWRKINFRSFLTIGGILIALFFLFMGGGCVSNNLSVTPAQIILTSTKPGTPTETATNAPTATNIPTTTATSLPSTTLPTLQYGADLISFDTKMAGNGLRTFGFYGTKGQMVTITLHNLRTPSHSIYALVLKNPNGEELAKEYQSNPSISIAAAWSWKDFVHQWTLNIKGFSLPNTDTYYINVRSPDNWELNLTLVTP